MKKLTHLYCLMLLLLAGTASAFAVNSFYAEGIRYVVTSNGTVSVASNNYYYGGGSTYSGQIDIPSIVKYTVYNYGEDYDMLYAVTAISDDAFKGATNLTGVSIPSSVKSIGKNAFYNCSSLTNVSIGQNVDYIKDSAFGYCTSLTSINLPNSVHYLGDNVFYGCSNLTNVHLPESVTELNNTFFDCTSLTSVEIPNSVVSLNGTFTGCTSLSSVTIPNNVRTIGDRTFDGCTSLSSIFIPNSVTRIGNLAFSNTALVNVDIPDALTSLGENAFYNCNTITSITTRATTPPAMSNQNCFSSEVYGLATLRVPGSATSAYQSTNWWNLFGNVSGDTSLNTSYDFTSNGIYYIITGDNTVSVTYRDTQYNSYSGTVNIPATITRNNKTYHVTGIANSAFRNCAALSAVNLPASIITIGNSAFLNAGIASISIPIGVTFIGADAFNGCQQLTSLTIPKTVEIIGTDAFANCNAVTSFTWNARNCLSIGGLNAASIQQVVIGNEVETIPVGFMANAQITTLSIPASVKYICTQAFMGCNNITSLTIPESVEVIGDNAFANTKGLTAITWNAKRCISNGGMYTNNITQASIGNNVEIIPDNFARNSKVTTITIPESVKIIGAEAFSMCYQLNQLTMPDGVESIGDCAFSNCYNLTTLTIPRELNAIGTWSFNGCEVNNLTWNARACYYNGGMSTYGITQVHVGDEVEIIPQSFVYYSQISSVDLPNTVNYISSNAFNCCYNLTSIIIPDNVTIIGNSAFSSCSNLTSAKFPKFLNSIGYYAFAYCSSLTEIILPENLTEIMYGAFNECDGLTSVTSLATEPPYLYDYGEYQSDWDCFYPEYNTATLHVPQGSVDRYQNDSYWKKFQTIVGITGTTTGDVDGDGKVNIDDVTTLISALLSGGTLSNPAYDVDGDGRVSIDDVTTLINILLKN